MTVEAVAKGIAVRDVELRDWGKVILEEVLFQAAQRVSGGFDTGAGQVEVVLTFRLAADLNARCLTITTPGAVEDSIVTRLAMPQSSKL